MSPHLRLSLRVCTAALLLAGAVLPGTAQTSSAPTGKPAVHTFTVAGRGFALDGKPFQIISGEMHYPRVPREYWRDRLRKAKQMGLNTITTYAFWNVHETAPGTYDFAGGNDLRAFLHDAQAEGLYVILRPGPYVCAEWELGGYPSWLLKDRALQLRSTNPQYAAAVARWFQRLGQEVAPMLLKNGGPIIAVQVENEYGAFGSDQAYLEQVKQQLIAAGLGDGVLFTSNQAGDLARGSLPELPSVVNFGSGGELASLAKLEAYRPGGVRMVGEYWAGWFDKWGEEHHQTDGKREAAEVRDMLAKGYSVSLYAVHGGTSFGWMNGADSHTGTDYHPDTTSYDYDAPLDEAGNPRYKYALLQHAIADATHTRSAAVPAVTRGKVFPVAPVRESASLWRNLPVPVNSRVPLTFEDLHQNFGYVLYRTGMDPGDGGKLLINGLHSYAQVYVDQQFVGTLDRRVCAERCELELPVQTRATTLDILVENTGRVNYSRAILTERAGITGELTIGGRSPRNWENFSLPMTDPSAVRFESAPCNGPCFFRTSMQVRNPADTYLDTRGLHKGQMWLASHNLGRFWSVGPQFTLYAPAPWLTEGSTPVIFFDLQGDATERLATAADPIYGAVTHTRESQ